MKKIIIQCDLCDEEEGGVKQPATAEALIVMNGRKARLDVCEEHSDEIVEIMNLEYVEPKKSASVKKAAPKVETPKFAEPKKKATPSIDPEQAKHIREWAEQNGFKVSDRGRIPQDVLAAYDEAHP